MSCGQTAETVHDSGKLMVAEAARLMGDNQQTLDVTNRADERSRDLHQRVEEAAANKKYPNLAEPSSRSKEEMKINIDSPTTVNHNYPLPESPVVLPSVDRRKKILGPIAKAALAAALIGSGAGVATLIPLALKALNPPPIVEPVVDTIGQIVVE